MNIPSKIGGLCGALLLSQLTACVLATNGLDYNRPMMPATEGGPTNYPGKSPAFTEPVPFTYPGMGPQAAAPAPAAPAAGAVVASAAPPPTAAAIGISNFSFTPSVLTVAAGSTVTWTNTDAATHALRFTDQDGTPMPTGGSYSRSFNAPGTYTYQCSVHPYMTGTVVVQ